jgi:hypothetical protein
MIIHITLCKLDWGTLFSYIILQVACWFHHGSMSVLGVDSLLSFPPLSDFILPSSKRFSIALALESGSPSSSTKFERYGEMFILFAIEQTI